MPTVRPVGVYDALPHPILVNKPQDPENTWIFGAWPLHPDPILVNAIVGLVLLAMKVNQTSYLMGEAVQPASPIVGVELAKLLVIFVQVAPGVRSTAPEQSSFAGIGESTIQISNPPAVTGTAAVCEKTLT